MSPVYKEINEVKSSALSFDSIVPMKEARKHLPDRVLMGNVSTYALEFGDPERVKMLTKSCIKSGSDIIAPACGLGMKSPLVNIQAILACMQAFPARRAPISWTPCWRAEHLWIIPAAARESAANVKCGSARGNCLPCLRRSGRF